MTQDRQDEAWLSLPEYFKKEVRCHYKNWHNSLAFEGECAVLDYLFGKHNLTETEEEPPLKATAAEILIQMAKDEMEIVNSDTPKSGTPDWLAYRMELTKVIAVELIRSGRDTTFLAESTSLIVDGIARRLKGGEK